jgi:ERCC4-type nuclease
MILVDSRVGSRDLIELLPDKLASSTTLDSGDVAFLGVGVNDEPWPIAVEIKTVSDALDSFHSGRFAGGQLPRLLGSYKLTYVLIEGIWQTTPDGFIQLGRIVPTRNGFIWQATISTKTRQSSFDNWITSIGELPGVRIKRSLDRDDTARQILNLYNRWQKPYSAHTSAFPQYEERWRVEDSTDSLGMFREPSFEEQVAKRLPRIGQAKAQTIAAHFGSVYRMVTATEDEWLTIPGLGKKTVKDIRQALKIPTS